MAATRNRGGATTARDRLLLALTLMAFLVQGFLTQTHVHFTPAEQRGLIAADLQIAVSAAAKHANGSERIHDRYPPNEDPANCPICQEILYAGHYVTPAAIAFSLPWIAISVVTIVEREHSFLSVISHNWQGRAPPSA